MYNGEKYNIKETHNFTTSVKGKLVNALIREPVVRQTGSKEDNKKQMLPWPTILKNSGIRLVNLTQNRLLSYSIWGWL